MELLDALRQRRMRRSFDGRDIDVAHLETMCVEALRAPTAGNVAGVSMAVGGRSGVDEFVTAATDPDWRREAPRAPGLLRAGGVVVVLAHPQAYADRYGESDKSRSGLDHIDAWSVPYWHTDAAMATMALLLQIEEAHWGATFWGAFRRSENVLDWCGAPDGAVLFGSVLVGHPDGADHRSGSLDRRVPRREDRVTRIG